MSIIHRARSLWRNSHQRPSVEGDLDEELAAYVELAAAEKVKQGMSSAEARRAALADTGGVEFVKENVREARAGARVESLIADMHFAFRSLRRSPGLTLVAASTLALGIGACTAIFSVVNAVMLRPLPYREPDQLAMLWTDHPRGGVHEEQTSYLTYEDWRAQSRRFADMAIFTGGGVTITSDGEPEPIEQALVAANLFSLLGVALATGRTFSAEEEARRERVVVISHELWQRRFGGTADIISKTLEINGERSTIIGVMPAGFYFPDKTTRIWEPATFLWRYDLFRRTRFHDTWAVIGRMKPGVTAREAQAEMTTIGQRLAQTYPVTDPTFAGFGVKVVPLAVQIAGKNLRLALWVLLGAVAFVLLIACTNVANLLLARGAVREREFAVRTALGARRGRLVQQLLIESGLLALGAGALGVALAAAGVRLLSLVSLPDIPRLDEVRIDLVVLGFTAVAAVIAGVLFGIVPAWRLSKSAPHEALKEGGHSGFGGLRLRQTRGVLVVTECALAVVLLAGAGLLIRSAFRLNAVDPGFKSHGVLLVHVSLPMARNILPAPQPGAPPAKESKPVPLRPIGARGFYQQVFERITALPGVEGVGAVGGLVMTANPDASVVVEGREPTPGQDSVRLTQSTVTAGFFRAMSVPLLKGRMLLDSDIGDTTRAIVINQTLARRYFPGEDPIGKRIGYGGPNSWMTIVGVVGDMRRQSLERQAFAEFFRPGSGFGDVVVRVRGDPLALAPTIRRIIHSVDQTATITRLSTVDRRLGELNASRRFQTWLLTAFAVLALVLSVIGIYGVMQYSVAQRTHEMGVRIALGARGTHVVRLAVNDGMKLALVGVAIGLVTTTWLTRLLTHLLYGVTATDPLTYGGVAGVLLAAALLACYLPAARAAKVDPIIALRAE